MAEDQPQRILTDEEWDVLCICEDVHDTLDDEDNRRLRAGCDLNRARVERILATHLSAAAVQAATIRAETMREVAAWLERRAALDQPTQPMDTMENP